MAEVDIANMALDLLTEGEIDALTDDDKPARLLNRAFAQTRKAELRKNFWSFAMASSSVTGTDLETGDGTLNWRFELPAGTLRVYPLTYDGEPRGIPISWRREGNYVFSDQDSPRIIRVVQDVTDPDDWDPLFTDVMAAALAMKIAHALTGKSGMIEIAQNAYLQAKSEARRVNAMEMGVQMYRQGWDLERGDTRYWRA